MMRAQYNSRDQEHSLPQRSKRVTLWGFLSATDGGCSLACGLGRRNDKVGQVTDLPAFTRCVIPSPAFPGEAPSRRQGIPMMTRAQGGFRGQRLSPSGRGNT